MNFAKSLSSTVVAATLLAALPALALPNGVTRQIKVDGSFREGVLTWTATAPPKMTYAYKLITVDGVIEVCGAYAVERGPPSSSFTQFLRDSSYRINGKRVIKGGLKYWNRVKIDALDTAVANCKSTGIPPANAATGEKAIYWSRRSYRI